MLIREVGFLLANLSLRFAQAADFKTTAHFARVRLAHPAAAHGMDVTHMIAMARCGYGTCAAMQTRGSSHFFRLTAAARPA
jgi:hypothetical protein